MANFKVKAVTLPTGIDFELEQDGDDVNILANGRMIAFFAGHDGRLYLVKTDNETSAKLPGLAFEGNFVQVA